MQQVNSYVELSCVFLKIYKILLIMKRITNKNYDICFSKIKKTLNKLFIQF
jgi:hypothetical protein